MPRGAVSLALETVGFRYPGQARSALQHVGFAIPPGKTLALVGPSGAGKTTAAQLMMRFWDPDQGRLVMNGTDLRQYKLDDLAGRSRWSRRTPICSTTRCAATS